jgi:hypothetical protein
MIEISQQRDRKFFVLCKRGAQPKFDIITIVEELRQIQNSDPALRVLFDWSKLKSWPFETPPLSTIHKWKQTVPVISHAAIVHNPKWNRHAALGALLRVSSAQVCSFSPSEYSEAVAWLEKSP